MKKRPMTTGERGWIGLILYIIAIDSIAWANQVRHKDRKDETMSVSWGRWLKCPKTRAATGFAWMVVSFHLFLMMPLPGEKTIKNIVQGLVRRRAYE